MRYATLVTSFFALVSTCLVAYTLAKEYSGQNFFDGWDFYGAPDLSQMLGDVNWVTEANAIGFDLAYVNDAGNAVIRVDNTTFVEYEQKRNSVRNATQDSFPVGGVFVIDAVHVPYGCSVWPSFWTTGPDWPNGGEIDIIETVNLMPTNQYALHTGGTGCMATSTNQTGTLGNTKCSSSAASSQPECVFTETAKNSVGQAFAAAGGGVYATRLDVSGIYIWFWSRESIPFSVTTANNTIDTSTWGDPSAAYPSSSCDISNYFGPQQLVLDITLWAGALSIYAETCPVNGTLNANTCYYNNVINTNGSAYSTAYFEVPYIKVFTTSGAVASTNASDSTFGSPLPTSSSGGGMSPTGSAQSGAVSVVNRRRDLQVALFATMAVMLASWTIY